MLSSDDSMLTLLWSPPEEATRITFLHYIPTSHNSDASLNSLPIWNLFLPILSAPSTLIRYVTSHSTLLWFLSLSLFARFRLVTTLLIKSTCLLLVCNLASLQIPHVMTNPSSKNKRVIATTCQKIHPWTHNIIHIVQILSMSWSIILITILSRWVTRCHSPLLTCYLILNPQLWTQPWSPSKFYWCFVPFFWHKIWYYLRTISYSRHDWGSARTLRI